MSEGFFIKKELLFTIDRLLYLNQMKVKANWIIYSLNRKPMLPMNS